MLQKRKRQSTQAYALWQKCHIDAIENLLPILIGDAACIRCKTIKTFAACRRTRQSKSFWQLFHKFWKALSSILSRSRPPLERTIINKVEQKSGSNTDDLEAIKETHCGYWEAIFFSNGGTKALPDNAMMIKVRRYIKSKLSSHQAAIMEKPVTLEEVLKVILELLSNKSVGWDSFCAELFQAGAKICAKITAKVINTISHA